MIINIAYRKNDGEFSVGKYSYYCDIPDLMVGDLVMAPTTRGDRLAKVQEVDVPENKIDAAILPRLKTIIERAVTTYE